MRQEGAGTFFKIIDKIVDVIVVIFLLTFLFYGSYALWDTHTMNARASSIAYSVYRPTSAGETAGFEELQAINPNVFGWIEVFGTGINYPLVQGEDNYRYVHTNARGNPAMSGAIFLDFNNSQDFTDFNNIIYGHDIASSRGAMFSDIANFEQADFFESHQYGTIFTGERYYGLEFFAFLLIDAHDFSIYNPQMRNPVEKENLIQRLFNDAIQYRALDVSINDRLVILSTCTQEMTNGRHILVGRLMNETPENPFAGVRTGDGIDSLMLGIGELGLAAGALFIILVMAGLTFLVARQKRNKNNLEEKLGPIFSRTGQPLTWRQELLFLLGKLAAILIVTAVLFTLIFGLTQVNDSAMTPAMREGDIVLFQRRTGSGPIARDTIVVRDNENQTQVRRVIAVAGDTVNITDQGLMINGLFQQELDIFEETSQVDEGIDFPLTVQYGEVFVLGDSRGQARDSRVYGTVRVDDILGSVVTIIRGRGL